MQQVSPQARPSRQSDDEGAHIQAHIFLPSSKLTEAVDIGGRLSQSLQAAQVSDRKSEAEVLGYGQSLGRARDTAVLQLQRASAGDGGSAVDEAALNYVALLQGLISQPEQPSSSPDLAAADSWSPTPSAPLRQAVAFQWQDVLLTGPQRVSGADAVFELASFLIAWALWQMRCAALLCQPNSAGSSNAHASAV